MELTQLVVLKLLIVFFANLATPLATEEEHLNAVSLYPNPANDYIKIQSEENISATTIYNVTGQKIKTFPIGNSNSTIINTRNLSNGFYYLKITTDNEKIIKKIIIQ